MKITQTNGGRVLGSGGGITLSVMLHSLDCTPNAPAKLRRACAATQSATGLPRAGSFSRLLAGEPLLDISVDDGPRLGRPSLEQQMWPVNTNSFDCRLRREHAAKRPRAQEPIP